jgi:Lipocalin-like domain
MTATCPSRLRAPTASRSPPVISSAARTEKERAAESYVSYCGRYEYRADFVTHHVELSLFPNWSGQDQKRRVELNGGRLTLEAPPFVIKGIEQRARLVWERF